MWALSVLHVAMLVASDSGPSVNPWATLVAGLAVPSTFCWIFWKANQDLHHEALEREKWINEQVIPLLTRVADAFSMALPMVQRRSTPATDELRDRLSQVLERLEVLEHDDPR